MFKTKVVIHNTRTSNLRIVRIFVNRLQTSFAHLNHQNSNTRTIPVLKAFNVFERLSFFTNVNNSLTFIK